MRIRHINNIVIELDEWETTRLRTILWTAINADCGAFLKTKSEEEIMAHNLMDKLNRLTEREA